MGSLFSKSSSGFVIHVKTGDRKCAGTDANVKIRLHDDSSNTSEPISLDNTFKNDLERGQSDTFKVSKDKVTKFAENAKITHIELWRDDSGLGSTWLVDTISVENRTTKSTFIFPIFRWIKANYHYHIKHLDTSLPQFEEFPDQRKMELEEQKKLYEYEQKIENGPVQVKNIPDDEQFSFDYKWDLLSLKLKLITKSKIKKLLSSGEFDNLEEITGIYDDFFHGPTHDNGWTLDSYFGYQRIASHNPTLIKLATEIPDKLPVTDAMLGDLLEGLTLRDAIDQKRLFICDYERMDGIPTKPDFTICAPIGLFFVNGTHELMPVAIQLYQKPGPDNPIFTPKDNTMVWNVVKMWFNNADAGYHQAITHLGSTHLMMEGVAISAHRNLSVSHPVFKILAPHFLYIIAINARAVIKLLPPGNWIDNNMNAGTYGTTELALRGFTNWRMDVDGTLPEDLKSRGLYDTSVLPTYHYREDALDVYEAIKKYVTSYINHYYKSNDMLKNDFEIQNWAKELCAERGPRGCGLQGVPGNGQVTSTDQLIQIITCVIGVCSLSHAAANFPQYSHYCYPLNYPAFMKGKPPSSKDTSVTEKDILNALPDRPTTLDIMVVTKLLSTQGTQSLGDFEVHYVYDPDVLPFIEEFKKDLKETSAKVKARNEKRKFKYDFLDPEFIPNSISI